MLRTVKYLSLLVVQFIGALLGVGALFIAFYAVSTPLSEFESAGWRILGMAFACGMMFPFVLQASLSFIYCSRCLKVIEASSSEIRCEERGGEGKSQ